MFKHDIKQESWFAIVASFFYNIKKKKHLEKNIWVASRGERSQTCPNVEEMMSKPRPVRKSTWNECTLGSFWCNSGDGGCDWYV